MDDAVSVESDAVCSNSSDDYERPCDGMIPPPFVMNPPIAGHYLQPEPVAEMARWPQMTTLIRHHDDAVRKILNACDECEVVGEVAASDSGNVKGNKWVRLHDVVFGGRDDSSRGLIPQFPVIPLPSKFKKKVVSIWKFGLDKDKVPVDIHRYCMRQHKAHQETCKKQLDSNKAAKEKYAELAGKMIDYEKSVGALPPGAKVPPPPGARPPDGGGRMNHSTNLQSRQPAGYGFVVQQQQQIASLPPMQTSTASSNTTRPTTPASSQTATTPLSSSQVNAQAMNNLNRLGNTFDSVVARLMPRETVATPTTSSASEITLNSNKKRKHQAKIDKARKKKKELEEQIAFMRPMKDDTSDNMVHFADITRQYIQASRDVVNLINETSVEDDEN